VDFLCAAFPLDLGGLTIVLDCAHGATYRVAPRAFRRLGARVLALGARPTGTNINKGVGALHPEALQKKVRGSGASVGFAFGGDGVLSALVLLSVAAETGETLASLAACMQKFPQVLLNVKVGSKPPLETVQGLGERVAAFEQELGGNGRILLRYSGTEPLARVMLEGPDASRIGAMADELAGIIRRQLGR